MLEIRKAVITLDETELIELEKIIIDGDKGEALSFLKKIVYDRIVHSQQGKLKSHLDYRGDVVEKFKAQPKQ